jgi:arylsulfatase
MGDWKVVRRKLKRKRPGDWKVYDLASDPGETKDLAAERPEVIQQAKAVLDAETLPNSVFPVEIPGVNAPGS